MGALEGLQETFTDSYKFSAENSAYISSSLTSMVYYEETLQNWVIGTRNEIYARLEGYKECPSSESKYQDGTKWFVYDYTQASEIEAWQPGTYSQFL